MRKVWITKSALTNGIYEAEVDDPRSDFPNLVSTPDQYEPHRIYSQNFHRPDWHETREAAVERANKMVAAKIASLTRQLEKLKKMEFSSAHRIG